jgi:cyanophycinase
MRHIIIMLTAMLALAAPARAQGQLVIVGGGLADDNDAVFAAFLDALPASDAPVAIIPVASGVPVQSAAAFAAQLEQRGVASERIRIIRLAVEDDPDTPEDESLWRGNADRADEVNRLVHVGGIWFTGGDQARILAAMLRPDGDETAMLAIIRARFAAGAVIGGTSAGAAMMSNPMILQGDPLSLVPGAEPERERVVTGAGLGFLRRYLVDQHFGERARLIRLVAALQALAPDNRIGLGIDEDTALVVAPDQRSARVIGRGRVTYIDGRDAEYRAGHGFAVRGAAVAMISDGETIDLAGPVAPGKSTQPAVQCLSATSAAGLPASQSEVIAGVTASLETSGETTCLITAGTSGLALRFYRTANAADQRVRMDIAPVTLQPDMAEH